MDEQLFEVRKKQCQEIVYLSKTYWQLRAECLESSLDETLPNKTREQYYHLWHILKER